MKKIYDHSYLLTLAECPRKHFYRHRLRLIPREGGPAYMTAGSAMHLALAAYYENGMDLDAALATLRENYTLRPFGNFEYLTLGHLETVMKGYDARYRDREPYRVIAMIEEPVTGTTAGLTPLAIGGIPDMIVEEDGKKLVLDHKNTTGYLGDNLYNKVKFQHQMRIYCILATQLLGESVTGAVVNALYIGKYASSASSKAAKFDRYRFDYTSDQLEETEQWISTTVAAEHHYSGGMESEHEELWPQCGGVQCGFCEFATLCEAPPRLRPALIRVRFQPRPEGGILASGADAEEE